MCYKYLVVLLFALFFFPNSEITAQISNDYFIGGVWHRNDDKLRSLSHTDYGILMITSNNEYRYYRIRENEYQMKWTESPSGVLYRWTLKVIDDGTINNFYQVQNRPESFFREYKKLEL